MLNRSFSLLSRVLEVKTVVSKSKLSASLYVELSDSCRVYSVLNHEMGTSPQPMFLSVLVSIMSGLSWKRSMFDSWSFVMFSCVCWKYLVGVEC